MASVEGPPVDLARPAEADEAPGLEREAILDADHRDCEEEELPSKPVNDQDGAVLDNEWYDLLQRCVESQEFLKKLESICTFASKGSTNGLHPWQEPFSETEAMEGLKDSYVIVTREDAVESMAHIIATSVSKCPEAQKLPTGDLHRAVVKACKDLKTSKLKSAWQWSKFLYRAVALGYSAFQVFEHPWLMRVIANVLWQVPRTLWNLLF